jgi:hypothetical protein
MRFKAKSIRILEEDDTTIVAFGDVGETPSVGVILSVSHDDDQRDKALGIDGLHFEAIGANVSGYHLISSLEYDGQLVRIELRPSVEGIDHVIEIQAADLTCERAALGQAIKMMSSRVQ